MKPEKKFKKEQLRILDQKIDLIIGDNGGLPESILGNCNMATGSINVRKNLSQEMFSFVSIHEVLHFIADMNSIKLNEQAIDGLALGINSFIRNNEDFVTKYFGYNNKEDNNTNA